MLTAPRLQPGRRALPHVLRLLGLQYGRFVLVGLGATMVHVLVYAATIEFLALPPLLANALGFAMGVNISFVGHGRWTFRSEDPTPGRGNLLRFWAVALLGLALNTAFVQLVTGVLMLHYVWSIPLIAGVTPLLTFTLSRSWAFRS